jgi:hypothetical protein
MTASAASPEPRPGPQPNRPAQASAAELFAELSQVHATLGERITALETLTADALPSKMEYTSARLRLSQASIDRRSLLNKTLRLLEERSDPPSAAAAAKVRAADGELIAHSVAHLAKWTTEAVANDWRGYCEASRAMRDHMTRTFEAEAAALSPVLQRGS